MVQFGFYFLTVASFFMISFLLKKSKADNKVIIKFGVGFVLWCSITIILSRIGIFDDLSLPPRIPLLIVFPMIFLNYFIVNSKFFQPVITSSPLHIPVFLQSFRVLVELLIYGGFLNGIFPQRATFEGMNYDILVGISALIIGYLIKKKLISKKILFTWNIISLTILSVTVYAFIYSYYFADYKLYVENLSFMEIPYFFLPTVLLPTAIFLHFFSIKQTFRE